MRLPLLTIAMMATSLLGMGAARFVNPDVTDAVLLVVALLCCGATALAWVWIEGVIGPGIAAGQPYLAPEPPRRIHSATCTVPPEDGASSTTRGAPERAWAAPVEPWTPGEGS